MDSPPVLHSSHKTQQQHRQAEKKLRKRRELDAMVANISRKRNACGTIVSGASNSSPSAAHQELLRGSDETSDDSFGLGAPHEGPLSMSGVSATEKGVAAVIQSPSLLYRTCRNLWLAFTVGASFIIIMTVLGLHVQMKMQLDTFRTELEQVLGERNDLNEKYQSLSSIVQKAVADQATVQQQLEQTSENMLRISNDIKTFNASLEGINQSLRAAPELKDLPKEVDDLKNDVAKFGSKLAGLETKINSKNIVVQRRSVEQQELSRRSHEEAQTSLLHSVVNATNTLRLDVDSLNVKVVQLQDKFSNHWQDAEKDIRSAQMFYKKLESNFMSLELLVNDTTARCLRLEQSFSSLSTQQDEDKD